MRWQRSLKRAHSMNLCEPLPIEDRHSDLAPRRQSGGCVYRILLLDNVPVAQVECFGAASLAVEIVLQFTPFAEEGAAIAAINWRRLLGIVGNVHQDRPASLAIEFVVQLASHFPMIAHFHPGANRRFRREARFQTSRCGGKQTTEIAQRLPRVRNHRPVQGFVFDFKKCRERRCGC